VEEVMKQAFVHSKIAVMIYTVSVEFDAGVVPVCTLFVLLLLPADVGVDAVDLRLVHLDVPAREAFAFDVRDLKGGGVAVVGDSNAWSHAVR
jgi:hypothetical protein